MISPCRTTRRLLSLALFCALLLPAQSYADKIRVAVASNFTEAMRQLAARFEADTNHQLVLIFGSTGKHYAQISHGAPFDAFFAADVERPQRLEAEGLATAGSRFTYAIGKLLLWSPDDSYVDADGAVLKTGVYRHLSIANPRLAPYGRAAKQVLEQRGLWASLRGRLVRGENIGQAFQFVRSGNAELGFIAASQVMQPQRPTQGSWWQVPQSLHTPIEQQAVVLNDTPAVRSFVAFSRSKVAREIIRGFGYDPP